MPAPDLDQRAFQRDQSIRQLFPQARLSRVPATNLHERILLLAPYPRFDPPEMRQVGVRVTDPSEIASAGLPKPMSGSNEG